MQQRRLRLGDILDDYCPRERRVTNHAVVAMLEEQVKQTRCTTCDAEHEYKEARVPTPRRRKDAGILGEPVDVSPRAPRDAELIAEDDEIEDDIAVSEPLEDAVAVAELAADDDDPPVVQEEDGPVHRRLIRATLPRPEGQAPEWKEPEFTIRQPGRGGREIDGNRGNGGGHGGHGQGQRPGGRHRRRGGGGSGGQGQGNAMGSRFGAPRGQGQQRHGSGPGQPRQGGNRPGGQPGNRGDNRGGGGQGGRRRGGR